MDFAIRCLCACVILWTAEKIFEDGFHLSLVGFVGLAFVVAGVLVHRRRSDASRRVAERRSKHAPHVGVDRGEMRDGSDGETGRTTGGGIPSAGPTRSALHLPPEGLAFSLGAGSVPSSCARPTSRSTGPTPR